MRSGTEVRRTDVKGMKGACVLAKFHDVHYTRYVMSHVYLVANQIGQSSCPALPFRLKII